MKYKLISFAVVFLALAGCEQPASTQTGENSSTSSQNYKVSDLVTVEIIQSSLLPKDMPKSAGELEKRFIASLKLEPEKAFLDYVDWQVIEEDRADSQ